MKALFKPIAMLLLVGALLLSMTAIASADGSQTWELDSTSVGSNHEMEKDDGPGDNGQSGTVSIADAASVIWIADEVSQGCTFPAGGDDAWTLRLVSAAKWDTTLNPITLEIGYVVGTSFTTLATNSTSMGAGSYALDITIQGADIPIGSGKYLAIRVTNNDGKSHTIQTDGNSWLMSPTDDPTYPTPELAAGVLLGLGLLVMGGFILIAKRRRTAALI